MKRIILIRHAKSSWKDFSLDDFDRPLNTRGKQEAPRIANYFKNQNIPLDKIFSSSAKRAKKTAKIFSDTLDVSVVFKKELYGFSVEELLVFIEKKLQKYDSIAIVAHNPELTELSNYLSDQYIDNIPTSAYVVLESRENKIKKDTCKLIDFIYPKKENIFKYV